MATHSQPDHAKRFEKAPRGTKQKMCFNKKTFYREAMAWQSARTIRKGSEKQLQPYPCPVCHHWHLTSS